MSQEDIRRRNLLKYIKFNFATINDFIEKIGESKNKGSFYEILKGLRPFGERKARKVEEQLGLRAGSLDSLNDELQNVIYIPEYNIKLSAGNGCNIFEEAIIRECPVDKEYIKQKNWQINKLVIFSVTGDSMLPDFQDGCKVIVDTSVQQFIEGKVYALCKNNEVFLKRVFREIGTANFVGKSDNSMFPNINFTIKDEVTIIGRVVCILGKFV